MNGVHRDVPVVVTNGMHLSVRIVLVPGQLESVRPSDVFSGCDGSTGGEGPHFRPIWRCDRHSAHTGENKSLAVIEDIDVERCSVVEALVGPGLL